jgi:hypothetical protein
VPPPTYILPVPDHARRSGSWFGATARKRAYSWLARAGEPQ